MNEKFISIVTPTFNEAENIASLVFQVAEEIKEYNRTNTITIRYEHIIIDNASTDGTQEVLRFLAANYSFVKVIINIKNYGQHLSPYYALMQCRGECAITLAADFEDPIELLQELIQSWISGSKVTCAVRKDSNDSWHSKFIRRLYYIILARITTSRSIPEFSGFGIFDREVLDYLKVDNHYQPYFRALVLSYGHQVEILTYVKKLRVRGRSSNNIDTLIETALLGIAAVGDKLSPMFVKYSLLGGGIALIVILVEFFFGHQTVLSLFIRDILDVCFRVAMVILLSIIVAKLDRVEISAAQRKLVCVKETINF